MTVHDDIWLTYERHWRERFGGRGVDWKAWKVRTHQGIKHNVKC